MGKRLGCRRCCRVALAFFVLMLPFVGCSTSLETNTPDSSNKVSAGVTFELSKMMEEAKDNNNIGVEVHTLSMTQTPEYIPKYTEKEIELLAHLAMAEAEGEDDIGKVLVMQVVLNRLETGGFGDSIQEIIFKGIQFSCIKDGRWDRVVPNQACWEIAYEVAYGEHEDYSQGALYFRGEPYESTWHESNLKPLFTHGKHRFYR